LIALAWIIQVASAVACSHFSRGLLYPYPFIRRARRLGVGLGA
jgi:hypothetical protein